MIFKSTTQHAFFAAYRSIKNKHVFLIVLSGVILLAVIAAVLVGILSQISTNSQIHQDQNFHYPDPSDQHALPDSVKVTDNHEMVLLHVSVKEGQQIYECQASTTDPSGYAWKLQAPFALLKADDGTNVIHSTNPTWLYTKDGSEVEGQIGQFTRPDGKVVPATAIQDANSIPWLRLDVTEHRGNNGLFSRVDQIQRLYTTGGKAPKDGCNRDTANGHLVQSIEYTAEYVFWGR